MKKVCLLVLPVMICLFMLLGLTSCSSNSSGSKTSNGSITINGESFSESDLRAILINDTHKAKQFVGAEAIVTGKVTEKSDGFYFTGNSNRFTGPIIRINNFCFGVYSSVLDNLELGDTITIKAKITHVIGSSMYCLGGSEIIN